MIDDRAVDLKKEISEFIKDEILLHGTERGERAAIIVNDFSTILCEDYKKKVSEWDTKTVKKCLMNEMANTPGIFREGGGGVVPIICRFLLHLHEHGHLPDAINMCKALLATDPAFKAKIAINDKEMERFGRVVWDLFEQKIRNMKDTDTNPDDTLGSTTITTNEETLRKTMIRVRCDEFCERFSDDTVSEGCVHLVRDLANHPESPLLRGDALLWSAAILYTACQRENLIRSGTGGSHLGEEIALYFNIKLPSMRSKVSAMKKYLTTTDTGSCKNEAED
jgi:hypothetical protein